MNVFIHMVVSVKNIGVWSVDLTCIYWMILTIDMFENISFEVDKKFNFTFHWELFFFLIFPET